MAVEGLKKTLVLGHRNPDTDSICSAICYAGFKHQLTGENYDSFSHCLAPFLAENYSEVILVDMRYYKNSISELAQQEKPDRKSTRLNSSHT